MHELLIDFVAVPGLRERKKERTRETIVRAALALFRKRGYDATTIADIAAAADISPRTFFSYFETKEAVVFHDFAVIRDRFAELLQGRGPNETTFDALRAWVVDLVGEGRPFAKDEKARHELIRSTPALQAYEHANKAEFEQIIAANVATDLDVPADSLRPRLVAAAAVATLSALDPEEHDHEPDEAIALVDEALIFLQGGLKALRKKPR